MVCGCFVRDVCVREGFEHGKKDSDSRNGKGSSREVKRLTTTVFKAAGSVCSIASCIILVIFNVLHLGTNTHVSSSVAETNVGVHKAVYPRRGFFHKCKLSKITISLC